MPKQILPLLLILLLASCTGGKKYPKAEKHANTASAPYELLVVGDKDWLQTTDGTVMMDALNTEILGLPQIESNFRIFTINKAGFNKTFQGFANIITFEFGAKYTQPEMKIARDVYAHPQIMLNITAPNGMQLAQFVDQRKQQIMDIFNTAEFARTRARLEHKHSKLVLDAVTEKFGYTIFVPEDINAVKKGKDFIWASSNKKDNRLNICVYTYPLTPDEDFSRESFIQHRNTAMRPNVVGAKDNQYMSTEDEFVYVETRLVDGHMQQQARGLWEMVGDMMGGPFVSYATVDSTLNQVIVAEGFVYAPEKKKRELIRTLEAAIQTLKKK